MQNTDIFKLIFMHDQRLDDLADRNANRTWEQVEATLADFMKPDPTFSKLYFTGTDLSNERFGLSILNRFEDIIQAMDDGMGDRSCFTAHGSHPSLKDALNSLTFGEVVVASASAPEFSIESIHIDDNSNVGHIKTELRQVLENDHIVIYKEKAHDGFDLHLFSRENIYRDLFYPLQALLPDAFRFFSINGKKFRSERHFYFETWTLDKPPHGFEEVFPESVL